MKQSYIETVIIGQAELDAAINIARLAQLWKSGSGVVSIPSNQAKEVFSENPFLYQLVAESFAFTGLPIIKDRNRYGLKLVTHGDKLIPQVGVGQWSKPVPEYAELGAFDAIDIVVMPTIGPNLSPDRYIGLTVIDENGRQKTVFSAQIDSNQLENAFEQQ